MARRALIAGAVVGVIALAAAGALYGRDALRSMAFFRVRRVECHGVALLEPSAIVDALALRRAASIFDDFGAAERRVRSLPGVAEARVSRRLPGTVRVDVVERVPVGLVPGPKGLTMIDARGRRLPYDPVRVAQDLPIVSATDSLLASLLARLREADPASYARIADATRDGSDIVLTMMGKTVRLRPEAGAEEMRAVTAVVEDLARRARPYTELDARYAGQVVVRRGPA